MVGGRNLPVSVVFREGGLLADPQDLPGPLPQLGSIRRFREDLEERCDTRVAAELDEVGS